jgi:hypothetical protein
MCAHSLNTSPFTQMQISAVSMPINLSPNFLLAPTRPLAVHYCVSPSHFQPNWSLPFSCCFAEPYRARARLEGGMEKVHSSKNKSHTGKTNVAATAQSKNQRVVVETITMTTVTEHRIVHETVDAVGAPPTDDRLPPKTKQSSATGGPSTVSTNSGVAPTNVPHLVASATNSLLINRNKSSINNQNLSNNNNTNSNSSNNNNSNNINLQQQQQHNNNLINNNLISSDNKHKVSDSSLTTSTSSLFSTSSSTKGLSTSAAITGILKGGKLWTKTDQSVSRIS